MRLGKRDVLVLIALFIFIVTASVTSTLTATRIFYDVPSKTALNTVGYTGIGLAVCFWSAGIVHMYILDRRERARAAARNAASPLDDGPLDDGIDDGITAT